MLNQFRIITYFTFIVLTGCSSGSGSSSPATSTPSNPPTQPSPGGGSSGSGFQYQLPVDEADGWQVASAATVGISTTRLEQMVSEIQSGQLAKIDSIAIARRGQLVFDETFRSDLDRFDREIGNADPKQHAQFSVSKSLAAIAIGVALQKGDIASEDVPYLSLFDYVSYDNFDANKNAIRLKDVLTMRMGIAWDEFNPSYFEPNNQLFSFHAEHVDWAKGLLDLPMDSAPDESFSYNTVATTSLGQAIQNSQPLMLEDYLSTHLALPLQITSVSLGRTPTNLPDLGRGVYLKSRDVAKFGQLLVDQGRWNGQTIISPDWVNKMTQTKTAFRWQNPEAFAWQLTGFGYQWWTGFYELNGEQFDAFAARGFGNQLMMVLPELEVVVVINSRAYESTDEEQPLFQLIADFVLADLED